MSHSFLHKWATWSKHSAELKSLKMPGVKQDTGENSPPDLKEAVKGKPHPNAVKQVDTTPAAASPSSALPNITNQAATSAQGIGDVYTNTSVSNYAKMACLQDWSTAVELMSSGSLCANVLNMRPR
jgi:hypothetical protein